MPEDPIRFCGFKVHYISFWIGLLACMSIGLAQDTRSEPDHTVWNQILQATVDEAGMVDYKKANSLYPELHAYLRYLSTFSPNVSWPKNRVLAFYINLYNALTVKLILNHYPLKSIRDIQNPWGQTVFYIDKKGLSLDDIEHKILRTLDEPRIHFAINCASVSCPRLRPNAFTEAGLEHELNKSVTEFFKDPDNFTIKDNALYLSPILKWYRADFELVYDNLINFINRYHDLPLKNDTKIRFLSYNWNLNESKP